MSEDVPTVLIVDDEVSVRESLKLLIESVGWHAGAFSSGRDFLSRPPTDPPCCLVLDLHLPDLSGLDIQALAADRTEMPIIFITGHVDVPSAVRAMKAGAMEFLLKPLNDELLLSTMERALERSRSRQVEAAEMHDLRDSYASLTHREQEVMARVVSGQLNKQVGGELGISEITVKAHRGRMMRKMKAASLPELVMMAMRLCLAPERGRRKNVGGTETMPPPHAWEHRAARVGH